MINNTNEIKSLDNSAYNNYRQSFPNTNETESSVIISKVEEAGAKRMPNLQVDQHEPTDLEICLVTCLDDRRCQALCQRIFAEKQS